jgi:branched-chain amino acid transport system permease protein
MTQNRLPTISTRRGRVLLELGVVLSSFLLLLVLTGFKFYWLTDFMIFCILVLSFDLLYGYLGHLSFGHILYYGTGAYVAASWMVYFNNDPLTALLVGVAVTTLLAGAVGWIAVQTEGAAFALLTMAFNELGYFVVHTALAGFTKGDDGLIASPGKVFGILRFGKDQEAFLMVLVVFLAVFAVLRVITRSPYGVLLRSIKENETRVSFLGYNTFRYKWLTFVISAAIAGLAGGLFVMVQGFVSPRAISTLSNIEVIFAILIGGAGTLYGAVVGGIVFMLIKNYMPVVISAAEGVVGFALPQWEMWLGIILLVIVFSFRKGVVGFLTDTAAKTLQSIQAKKGDR